jgi:hypothetical protein
MVSKTIKISCLVLLYAATASSMDKASRWLLTSSKILGGALSIGAPIADSLFDHNISIARLKNTSDVPENVEKWVKSQLEKNGINDWQKMKIVAHPSRSWGMVTDGIIILKEDAQQLSEALASKKNDRSKQIILKAKVVLRHESGHKLSDHPEKIQKANAFFGLVSHLGWHYAIETARKRFFAPTVTSNIFFSAVHLGSFPLKIKTLNFLNQWYSRKCEKEADEVGFSLARSKQELEFFKNFSEEAHRLMLDNWDHPEHPNMGNLFAANDRFQRNYFLVQRLYQLSSSKLSFSQWVEGYPLLMKFIQYTIDAQHPLDIERSQAADKALQECVKKSKV